MQDHMAVDKICGDTAFANMHRRYFDIDIELQYQMHIYSSSFSLSLLPKSSSVTSITSTAVFDIFITIIIFKIIVIFTIIVKLFIMMFLVVVQRTRC